MLTRKNNEQNANKKTRKRILQKGGANINVNIFNVSECDFKSNQNIDIDTSNTDIDSNFSEYKKLNNQTNLIITIFEDGNEITIFDPNYAIAHNNAAKTIYENNLKNINKNATIKHYCTIFDVKTNSNIFVRKPQQFFGKTTSMVSLPYSNMNISTNKNMVTGCNILNDNGIRFYKTVYGDGNCYFYSYIFSILFKLINADDKTDYKAFLQNIITKLYPINNDKSAFTRFVDKNYEKILKIYTDGEEGSIYENDSVVVDKSKSPKTLKKEFTDIKNYGNSGNGISKIIKKIEEMSKFESILQFECAIIMDREYAYALSNALRIIIVYFYVYESTSLKADNAKYKIAKEDNANSTQTITEFFNELKSIGFNNYDKIDLNHHLLAMLINKCESESPLIIDHAILNKILNENIEEAKKQYVYVISYQPEINSKENIFITFNKVKNTETKLTINEKDIVKDPTSNFIIKVPGHYNMVFGFGFNYSFVKPATRPETKSAKSETIMDDSTDSFDAFENDIIFNIDSHNIDAEINKEILKYARKNNTAMLIYILSKGYKVSDELLNQIFDEQPKFGIQDLTISTLINYKLIMSNERIETKKMDLKTKKTELEAKKKGLIIKKGEFKNKNTNKTPNLKSNPSDMSPGFDKSENITNITELKNVPKLNNNSCFTDSALWALFHPIDPPYFQYLLNSQSIDDDAEKQDLKQKLIDFYLSIHTSGATLYNSIDFRKQINKVRVKTGAAGFESLSETDLETPGYQQDAYSDCMKIIFDAFMPVLTSSTEFTIKTELDDKQVSVDNAAIPPDKETKPFYISVDADKFDEMISSKEEDSEKNIKLKISNVPTIGGSIDQTYIISPDLKMFVININNRGPNKNLNITQDDIGQLKLKSVVMHSSRHYVCMYKNGTKWYLYDNTRPQIYKKKCNFNDCNNYSPKSNATILVYYKDDELKKELANQIANQIEKTAANSSAPNISNKPAESAQTANAETSEQKLAPNQAITATETVTAASNQTSAPITTAPITTEKTAPITTENPKPEPAPITSTQTAANQLLKTGEAQQLINVSENSISILEKKDDSTKNQNIDEAIQNFLNSDDYNPETPFDIHKFQGTYSVTATSNNNGLITRITF